MNEKNSDKNVENEEYSSSKNSIEYNMGNGIYPAKYHHPRPYKFELGGEIPEFEIQYGYWGRLYPEKNNVILLETGLSGSYHAKSSKQDNTPGWWEDYIGPGKTLDTNKFFIICPNVIGGCHGSTGPTSINPQTGKIYGRKFPQVTLIDIINTQAMMLKNLGIKKLHAVVGSSMGGMQALQWGALHSDMLDRIICISAPARAYPQSIAFRYIGRLSIMNDPHFKCGDYYDGEAPLRGLSHARQLGIITYRSRAEWNVRFGREATGTGCPFTGRFEVENFLNHVGNKFAKSFDANSYINLTKAMDLFDLGYRQESYEKGIQQITSKVLIVGVTTDILFPIHEQREIYHILKQTNKQAEYKVVDSQYGHDSFLKELDKFSSTIKPFLEKDFDI